MDESYIGEVIKELNFNSSFNYNRDELPNNVPQNDVEANRKYSIMIRDHIKNVLTCWAKDTGIEDKPNFSYYGDYRHEDPNHPYKHSTPRSFRTMLLEEYQVDKRKLTDADANIRVHDRSRFSADEFYAAANYLYGTNKDRQAYQISQLKHYQRNAHEFTHYWYHRENGPTSLHDDQSIAYDPIVAGDIPDVYIWQRIASWLANCRDSKYKYNNNFGKNPFECFWGRPCYYVIGDSGTAEWGGPPDLLNTVQMSERVQSKIEIYVDRWAQVLVV